MRFKDFGNFKCNMHGEEDVLTWVSTHQITQSDDEGSVFVLS